MKKILAALLMLPALAMGAANDLFINQRNALDTGTLSRTVTIPAGGVNGIFGFNGSTVLPVFFTLGPSLTISGGVIDAVASAPTWASITGKPSFALVATSGAYADLSGKPALFSGAYADLTGIPSTFTPSAHTHSAGDIVSGTLSTARLPSLLINQTTGLQAALDSKFPAPTGSTAQYIRGDGSTAAFPALFSGAYGDLTGIPATFAPAAHTQAWSTITATPTTRDGYGITDAYPLTGNPSGFLTGITSGQVTGALGFTPYNATNPSAYINQAGARSAISLTTTGTAGAATYNSSTGVLNIPNYAPGTGTVTSVTAGTGLSGGTITTTGTISLSNTGTAGSYANVTTDAQGRVTAGTNRSQAAASRSLNTAFQINATRDAWVSYSVQITVTASIAGGQNGDVILEIASDSGFTANVQTLAISGLGQTYTLAVAIQGVQPQTGVVTGYVPAGYYARLRTENNTGTPAFSYRAGQEVLQ